MWSRPSANTFLIFFGMAAAACGGSIDIDVHLIDPCNQHAVQMMEWLKIEPRGEGIDSMGSSTYVEVATGGAQGLKIPLASDFQLVATGYADETFSDVLGLGVSAKRDLSNSENAVEVRVPFALVDAFYKTTALDDSGECTTLINGRYGATATFLPDSGKVLIVGGANLSVENGILVLQYIRLIEIYDPETGQFRDIGELKIGGGARAFHTATLLSDGRVLIAGGEAQVMSAKQSLKSALIIDASDPTRAHVSEAIIMREARTGHTATRLSDGRVVLAGGRILAAGATRPEDHQYLSSVEVFDPELETFTTPVDRANSPAELGTARFTHTAFTLKSGFDIGVFGGMNSTGPVLSIEVVHLDGNTMTTKTSSEMLGVGPIFHAGDINDRGEILLSGGYNTIADAEPSTGLPLHPTPAVEMYAFDNAAMEMRKICASSMATPRGFHTASLIGRNAIFIGGRGEDGLPQPSSETASIVSSESCLRNQVQRDMTDARAQHAVAKMQMSGELLVVGGRQQEGADPFGRSIDSAEVFSPKREP